MPAPPDNARRALMAAVLWPAVAAAGETVDVWVRLTLPGLTAVPPDAGEAERAAHRARVLAQQDAVMAALRALGGEELGRVEITQSALAVRLPRAQLGAARRLDGVHSVRPVRDLPRQPPYPPD